MKNRVITWMLVGLVAQSVQAEFRTWTGSSGSQLKAEFIEEAGDKIVLRDESGRKLKVPRSYLSAGDIDYLNGQIVPVLGIKSEIKVESEIHSSAGVVQVVKYTIEIRKVSSTPYESPVEVALYLVGSIGKDKTYVVLQRTQKQVWFTAQKRNPIFTGPDLALGSKELQKKYDIEYVGYLVIASTTGGRIIEVNSDNKTLETNAGFIASFRGGDLFGSDMKRIQ